MHELKQSESIPQLILRRAARRKPRQNVVELGKVLFGVLVTFVVLATLLGRVSATSSTPGRGGALAALTSQDVRNVEFSLGDFQYMQGKLSPVDGADGRQVQVVEFEAAVVVSGTESDLQQFDRELDLREQRVRQAVEEISRSISAEEMADPDLAILRGRVREKLNALFGRNVAHDILFGRFRVFAI